MQEKIMLNTYKQLRRDLAETIELVGNQFEQGSLSHDEFKELARNNYTLQRTLAINIGLLELMEKNNEKLQVQSNHN